MTKINGICEALADYQKMVQNSIIGLGSRIIRKTYIYSIICKIATFYFLPEIGILVFII